MKKTLSLLLLSSFVFSAHADTDKEDVEGFLISLNSQSPKIALLSNEIALVRHKQCGYVYNVESIRSVINDSRTFATALYLDHHVGNTALMQKALHQSASCNDLGWSKKLKKSFHSLLSQEQQEKIEVFEEQRAKVQKEFELIQ